MFQYYNTYIDKKRLQAFEYFHEFMYIYRRIVDSIIT